MKRDLEQELLSWKEAKEHLPILLRGARQVGKSYLVESFGKSHFEDTAIVDFERSPSLKEAFSIRDPKEIISRLEFALKKPIRPGSSLLFLDEIQECPQALHALRYFKEEMPTLHVIAAGSLLEFLLHEKDFSFPVGRIEFLYLRPFSFIEYLKAAAPFLADRLLMFDLNNRPTEAQHLDLLGWVHRFLFVGGMPSAIQASLNDTSLLPAQRVHHRILQAYESDFGKYAKHTQYPYLQKIFQKAPLLVSKIFKYSHVDDQIRSRELKMPLDLLNYAGIFQRIYGTTAAGLPLHAHIKDERFKLLYLDVGLLQTMTKVDATLFFNEDILQINSGMIAEQFVGQELLAYSQPFQNDPLLYWERESSTAEIDFITSIQAEIIPIEVKAGSTGALRSLHLFLKEKKAPLGVRISEQPLTLQGNVLSIPLYLINSLPLFVKQALSS